MRLQILFHSSNICALCLCELGYGMMTDGTTTFVNASACTVNFQPMNSPIVFDLPNPRSSWLNRGPPTSPSLQSGSLFIHGFCVLYIKPAEETLFGYSQENFRPFCAVLPSNTMVAFCHPVMDFWTLFSCVALESAWQSRVFIKVVEANWCWEAKLSSHWLKLIKWTL